MKNIFGLCDDVLTPFFTAGTCGAKLRSELDLTSGMTLQIVVGQCGETAGAGSGASVVALFNDTSPTSEHRLKPLAVAGGAGGALCTSKCSNAPVGRHGEMSDTIRKKNSRLGTGGNGFNGAGGGAGFHENGSGSKFKNAKSVKKLSLGGKSGDGDGGFGGGGAGYFCGGGGGYTGGHGGTRFAGGGGSFSVDQSATLISTNLATGKCKIVLMST